MKKNVILLLGIFLGIYGNAQVMPLKNILDSIEKNNPLLLSYQNRINSANALVPSANTWNPPKVGVEFDQNPYSFDNFYNGVVRISLSQDFPNRKSINAQGNYLSSLAQIEVNEFGYERNKLFSEAKSAYYGIYIMQKDTTIINQNIRTLNAMIDLSEKQMATGKGDVASVYILQAKLADKQTTLIHDENMIKTYIANLNYLMNVDADRTFSIDTNNILKNYRNLFSPVKDSIEFRRSDIMQVNSMIYSMQLNQAWMGLQGKPIFGFKVEHFSLIGMPDMFSIMGTMTIPFAPWSSRGYKSKVNSMRYTILANQQEKQNMVSRTYQTIRILTIEMNSEYQEIDSYNKKVIPAYQKSFDANLLAYGQNTNNLSMVLMAYDDLQMAQMEYLKHLQTLLNVQVDYEKEMQIQ
jgi:outer membrane protein TolC